MSLQDQIAEIVREIARKAAIAAGKAAVEGKL